MRCLHCGNRISLLRKLKDSEFCSDEHREFHALQQQQLAVARLMETSSPRHPSPLDLPGSNPGRALPKGADRRAIDATPPDSLAPATTAPRRQPLSVAVKPQPASAAAPAAEEPAPSVARVTPLPVEVKPPALSERVPTHNCGMVAQSFASRNWSPRHWHRVMPQPEPLMPTLAAPLADHRVRHRMPMGAKVYRNLLPAPRQGAFPAAAWCEAPVAPEAARNFSELLSLWLHGFVCEQALNIDKSFYSKNHDAPTEPAPVPLHSPAAAPGTLEKREWVEGPENAVPAVGSLPRLGSGLQGGMPAAPLPAIDDEERRMRIAESRVPGFVKLRPPRVRMPLLARMVRPATGNSAPPSGSVRVC